MQEREKNKNKEKGENIGTCVAMCRYLSSQTYTPWPDTTRKKLERVLYTNWLARARRKGQDNQ